MLKTIFSLIAALMAASLDAIAEPLAWEHISSQAKWLIHFDADRFRTTQAGSFYVQHVLAREVAGATAKHSFDFGPLLRSLKSATAYGTQHQGSSEDTGVLLLHASAEAVSGIAGALAAWLTMETLAPEKPARIKRFHSEPYTLYQIDKETLIAPLDDGRLLFGKSRGAMQDAWETLAGNSGSLASSQNFEGLHPSGETFLCAAARDFNSTAKILRQTRSGNLTLGERGGDLVLTVRLQADSNEAAAHVQQLAEGLLAWVAAEKPRDVELQALAQSARITSDAQAVTAAFNYPIERVLNRMMGAK